MVEDFQQTFDNGGKTPVNQSAKSSAKKYEVIHTFDYVNAFVNSVDVEFEDMQMLCLAMASEIERIAKLINKREG